MIELPGFLEWLEPIVGMEWPEGNEDQMWALAQDWHTAAADLRTILSDIDAAKNASLTAYPVGEGVEEMIKGFDSMRSGDGSDKDQSLNKLAELFDQIGESANGVGTEIEYAKLMYWSSLGLLAGELAAAWLFPPTAPAVEAAAIGLTRIAVRIIGERVVSAIIRHAGKLVASKLAKFLLRHVAIDTMLGTLQELGVQQWQVDHGHRKSINWDQVAVTAVSSAAGGAAAGPFGDWLGNRLSSEMKPWMRAAITGPAAGLVGAGAGFVAATGTQFGIDAARNGWGDAWNNLKNTQVDWRMFTAGASNGAMSGLNKVGAQHAWGNMRPDLFSRPGFGGRFDDVFNGSGGDGANSSDGTRVGLRPDGAGLPAGDGSGRGTTGDAGATRPAGTTGADGNGRAGGDAGARQPGADAAIGRNSIDGNGSGDSRGSGDGRNSSANNGSGDSRGSGDGRNSGESDGSGDSRSGDAGSRSSDAATTGRDRAAGDSTPAHADSDGQTRTGDGSTRPVDGAASNPDRVAAQTGSGDAVNQRAGVAPQADAVHGVGSDERIDATSTGNEPVSVRDVDGGLATNAPTHAAPPTNPGSAPTNPGSAPAHQASTNPAAGGESRSTPAASSSARPGPGEVRAHTGSDAPPRVEQPRTQTGLEPRAGAPDGRPAGEARPSADRPRTGEARGDGTAPRTSEPSRTGVAGTPRGANQQSALQSGSSGEHAPRARTTEDGSTTQQAADAALPTDGPQSRHEGDGPSPLDAAGLLPLAAVSGADAPPRADRTTTRPDPVVGGDDDHTAARPDPSDTEQPRDCAIRSLELIRQLTGSDVIDVPTREIGPDGVSQSEIERAANAPLRDVENHNEIRDALMYETRPDGSFVLDSDGNRIERPDGVAALVVDVYGKTDEHNVGAHAYVLLKENGEIVVHDPTAGLRHGFPPILPGGDYPVQVTRTILFDENGIPQQRGDADVPSREPALRNVDVGQRPPGPDGDPVEPASGSDGGGKKPPAELPPLASPDDPGDGSTSKTNRDNDSGAPPVLEPDSVVLADDTHPLALDVDGEQVPLALHPDGEDRWRAVPADEAEPPARQEGSGEVEKKSPVRRAWERIRDRIYIRGYEGDNPKYPSGSGEDGRGQTALRDGVANAPHLFEPSPAPAPHVPQSPDVPHMGPAPDSSDKAPNVARILKEGATIWKNREHLPILGQLSGRTPDVAGDFVAPRTADGEEYRFWVSDADPDLVRETITDLFEVQQISAEEARAVLEDALSVSDPEQRQRIVDDMERLGLVSEDEARVLEQEPPEHPELPREPDGPPPEHESLSELADRLGFDLPDDDPATVRRVIDEQEYRTLREAAAIEGLADAHRRYNEEQTRPYTKEDVAGEDSRPALDEGEQRNRPPGELEGPDARRRDEEDEDFFLDEDEFDDDAYDRRPVRVGEPDPAGRPVPYSDEVSFFDDNPMGRFLKELNAAFDGASGVQHYTPVGNGADPLKEWGDIGPDDNELGRDQGPRAYFEHALRRDQLRDELSTWAQMFGLDNDSVTTQRIDELRAANQARADRLAEFADAAEIRLHPESDDQPPVGEPFGDQVVRLPVGEGVPDRLVVIDGPQDRAAALARVLAEHPDLAQAVNRGDVQVDYHKARTDRNGHIHLEPVETPDVYHHRERIDGRDLAVTLLRDSDGQWRPVVLDNTDAPHTEPLAADAPETPPRPRAEVLTDLVDLARTLGLQPDALHPERLAQTIADMKLDNAVRAGQIEALADFARSMNAIESFNDIGDARSQLATRLGIPEAELTPQRLGEALTDSSFRNALRAQQVGDLVAYAKQLRDLDPAAFVAARDQLAKRLGVEPSELFPPKYSKNDAGRLVHGLDSNSLDPKKLRKLLAQMERDGKHDLLKNALTEYADALIKIDPYSEVPRGDLSADPRVTGEPPIHDPEAIHGLRDIIRDALHSGDTLDFGQTLADHPGRPEGDGTWDRDSDRESGRPDPNRDWARLVGVDLAGADDATFRKVYEAYRDGKIEKHEGLSPKELAAEIAKMRDEVRQRAAQIRDLADLAEEFYRAPEQLPAGDQPGHPGDGATPPRLDGPDEDGPAPTPTPIEPAPRRPGSGDAAERPIIEGDGPRERSDPDNAVQQQDSRRLPTEPGDPAKTSEPVPEDPASAKSEVRDDRSGADQQPAPRTRIDEALARELAALDESYRRRSEEADAELQRVLDHLDQIGRDLAGQLDGHDVVPESDSVEPSTRIDEALAREVAKVDEAYRRHADESDAELRRVLDHLEQVGRELAGQHDVVPPSDSANPSSRIDAALARELAALDESYRRHSDEADAELQRVLDHLDQIARDLAGQLDTHNVAPEPDSTEPSTRIDEALARELAKLDEAYRRHAESSDADLRRALDHLEQILNDLAAQTDHQRLMADLDNAHREMTAKFDELARRDSNGPDEEPPTTAVLPQGPPSDPPGSASHDPSAHPDPAPGKDLSAGTEPPSNQKTSTDSEQSPQPKPGAELPSNRDATDDSEQARQPKPGSESPTNRESESGSEQSPRELGSADESAPPQQTGDDGARANRGVDGEPRESNTRTEQSPPRKSGSTDESTPRSDTGDGGARTSRGDGGEPPESGTGHRDSRPPQLPGRALRSHIPHPPRDYEFEFPRLVDSAPKPWPVPDPQPPAVPPPPPPKPPQPPRPPVPPHVPVLPNPPHAPVPPRPPVPVPPDPPVPPHVPVPPDLPVPPQVPVPPDPPVPPQIPVPPNLPVPPQVPVPPNLPEPPGLPDPPNLPEPPQIPVPPNLPVPPEAPVPPNLPSPPHVPVLPTLPHPPPSPGGPIPPGVPGIPVPSNPLPGGPIPSNDPPGSSLPPWSPMPPPPMGGGPHAGGNGRRNGGNGNGQRSYTSENGGGATIVVRPYVGYGVFAEFDPMTGALRATPAGASQLGGVYADLGDAPVVLYRHHGRLGLRVGGQDIDLDGPVAVDWYPYDQRNTRFVVSVAGVPAFDVIYRSLPADMDLGLLVRDVLADASRRAAIFA
ncbi:hypothetical protein ACQPW1_05780 [Nocardia sp. CA-128927]|uniref:WXG100-like domain-containing protein n=1 Tax=Nocardia sp. CA-128927 TaxID=3239975 RepID=UPI003D996F81